MSLMKGLFDRKASNQPFNPSDDIPRSTTQEAIQYAANGGGGSGAPAAPDDAQYLVSSSNGDLTNERVISNGLGITWDFSGIGSGIANLDFYGLQNLTAPAADRGLYFDVLDGAFKFFEPTIGLGFSAGTLGITDPDLVYIVNTTFSQGDLLYHNGTTLQRLPRGVDGQFLRTRGASNLAPDWQNIAGGGDMLRANNLSDLTDFTAARENIGLGETDSPEFTDLLLTGNGTINGNLEVGGYGFFGGGAMGTQFADPGVYLGIETNGNAQFNIVSTGTYGYFDIGGINEDYKMRFLVEIATGNTTIDPAGTFTSTKDLNVPDEAYDASAWNGSTEVPTKNAVRDKIESILDGQAFSGAITVPDDAYAVGWNGSTEVPTKNAVYDKIELVLGTTLPATYQPLDADLTQIAAFSSTGFAARTASNTWAQRSLTAPAAGFTITNPAGIAGNPTFVLANDLAALEGLSGTGFGVRSASDTWVQRSLANAAAGITWTNADGVSGNPTPVLANDLAALEGLGSTGFAVRSASDTWVQRSLSQPAAGLTITNNDGVSGNPTFALANDLAALEALSGTNTIYYRSASDTWSAVTIGTALGFSAGSLAVTDAELVALAGLTSAADRLPYFTGSGTASLATFTSAARDLLDDSDAATMRATLGLTIGTNVQAYDALLASIAGLTFGADNYIYGTGSDTAAVGTISSVGRTLISQTTQALARTTGLGFSANGSSLVAAANYAAMRGLLDLEAGTDFNAYSARLADVAGISWTQGDLMYFNGTNLVRLPPGTSGQYLSTNGVGANPSWVSAAGSGTVTDITAGVGLTTGGSPITVSGTVSLDFGIVDPTAASESSNELSMDVNDGANLFFQDVLSSHVEVQPPIDMPDGSTITLLIDPTQHPTSAPVLQNHSNGTTASGTSHSITLPSSISAGDLLVVCFSVDGNPTVTVNTGSSGSNWQKLGQASNGSSVTGCIFYKIAEGGDALVLTTSATEEGSYVCARITGVMTNVPDFGGTSSNGSSTNGDPPLHTPTHGTQNYLMIATISIDAQVVPTVAPSGYSNLTTQAGATSSAASTGMADRTASVSSENPGTFTNTSEQWVCWTLMIGPYGIYDVTWHSDYATPHPTVAGESLVQIQSLGDGRYVAVRAWTAE